MEWVCSHVVVLLRGKVPITNEQCRLLEGGKTNNENEAKRTGLGVLTSDSRDINLKLPVLVFSASISPPNLEESPAFISFLVNQGSDLRVDNYITDNIWQPPSWGRTPTPSKLHSSLEHPPLLPEALSTVHCLRLSFSHKETRVGKRI